MKKVKTMKKSMFFTTILMVVLLIVALSTATFAWFSANNTVTATQTTMTAATTSSANIAISWDGSTWGSTISFDPVSMMQPAIPEIKPQAAAGTTEAQYIATNYATPPEGTVTMNYGNGTPTAIRVVGMNKSDIIGIMAEADLITAFETQLGDGKAVAIENAAAIAPFARLYKTKDYEAGGYVAVTGTLAAGSFEEIDHNGSKYDYLEVSNTNTGLNYITSEAAASEPYNVSGATNGQKIYNKKEVPHTYTVQTGAPLETGFIAKGVALTAAGGYSVSACDYITFMTANGVVDMEKDGTYYIHELDARATPYNCREAVDGDAVYCVTAAGTATAITQTGDFISSLKTASVNVDERFKEDGVSTNYAALNEFGAGNANAFYIKNTAAIGSAAANITLSATLEGGKYKDVQGVEQTYATNDIMIAVFVKEGAGNFNYKGTIGQTKPHYGKLFNGAHSAGVNFGTFDNQTSSLSNFISIGATNTVQIQFVVWYEGTILTAEMAGKVVNISFTFTAA